MIECIFTIDYEIYGNGEGSLRDLVYEPAERLMAIFQKWGARFVAFIEVAELEMIEANKTDHSNIIRRRWLAQSRRPRSTVSMAGERGT